MPRCPSTTTLCGGNGISTEGEVHHAFTMHLLTVREDMEINPLLEGQERLMAAYTASLDALCCLPVESLPPSPPIF